jgi:hypothetical protein
MLILASFSISLMPPALPEAEKAGAAAAPAAAAGAAAGAAAAGAFGLSFNCIDISPSFLFAICSLENAVSLQSLDDLHELAFS